jgi:hypothetical protein
MRLRPVTLDEARAFVAAHHRHANRVSRIWRFGVGLEDESGALVGVAIAGRPVARPLDDGWTIEISRCCLLVGRPNAASRLYGALCRAAKALGYRRAITYTLADEPGRSLRAAGFRPVITQERSPEWHPARPRLMPLGLVPERHPEGPKVRWEREL